jgi:hypothetical protein
MGYGKDVERLKTKGLRLQVLEGGAGQVTSSMRMSIYIKVERR